MFLAVTNRTEQNCGSTIRIFTTANAQPEVQPGFPVPEQMNHNGPFTEITTLKITIIY